MRIAAIRISLPLLLCLLVPIQTMARSAPASASLTLLAPSAVCESARLGDVTTARGEAGTFVFTLELSKPGAHRLECGAAYEIFLAPGDDLRVTLGEAKSIAFAGRGAPANDYLSAEAVLSMLTFAQLAHQKREAFLKSWRLLLERDLERLKQAKRQGADASLLEQERVRLQFRWAQGRVMYPFFHWRESDERAISIDPDLPSIIKRLPVENPKWWALPEHQALIGAYIHALARDRLQRVRALSTGDNRWLRAEMHVVAAQLVNPSLRLRELTRLITTHIDENGAKGIEPLLEGWRALPPDPGSVKKVDEMIAYDKSQRDGHVIGVYRQIDGVALEIHVLEPTVATKQAPRPAMLWLHGGSFTEGTWWHSPGVSSALRKNGVVVVAVEMRTSNRFNSGPLEQISDASAAYHWLKERASDYRIDPDRIGVAGFSSGATLALILATRGMDPKMGDQPAAGTPVRPAAVLTMGACANPISDKSDGWFGKMVTKAGRASDYSPAALVTPGLPRLLAVHATGDEYCEYSDLKSFVESYQSAGNDAELSTVEGASHFFGFYYKPGLAQAQAAIASALRRWGWSE